MISFTDLWLPFLTSENNVVHNSLPPYLRHVLIESLACLLQYQHPAACLCKCDADYARQGFDLPMFELKPCGASKPSTQHFVIYRHRLSDNRKDVPALLKSTN